MMPWIKIRLSKFATVFLWAAISGCTATHVGGDGKDPYINSFGKEIAVSFPAWTSESDKSDELRKRAEVVALQKCGNQNYSLVGMVSRAWDGSKGSFIGADISCHALGSDTFATKSQSPVTEQQLANVSDKHICATAIERNRPVWSSVTQWVRAAQRRSLTQRRCASIIGRFTEQQIAAVHGPPKQRRANIVRPTSPSVAPPKVEIAAKDSDERLCQKAIQQNSPEWETISIWRKQVLEAKRRGLGEQQCARLAGWFTEQQIAAVHNPKPPAVRPTRKPKVVAKAPPEKPKSPHRIRFSSGSGFFVSKSGHVVTNAHVVNGCSRITVGDNANAQTRAALISTDRRNDLALLKLGSLEMASAETKSLIKKLGIKIVPLVAHGLLRPKDVELGESVLVAGFPYGELYSNTIKVTGGMVSAVRGIGDDSAQFQMDAAAQSGNSGGPIYDTNGNIVGVVVAQLNKFKVAKATGSLPENVNFGIKASTVRQFLNTSGLPSKWSTRSKRMSPTALAKIAQKQTLMVICHR
jgi:S1-C subfamily serine protease